MADEVEGGASAPLEAEIADAPRGRRSLLGLLTSRQGLDEARERSRAAIDRARGQLRDLDREKVRQVAEETRQKVRKNLREMTLIGAVTRYPFATVGITLLITSFFVFHSGFLDDDGSGVFYRFKEEPSLNVNGDMAAYLPSKSSVVDDIEEVEQNWTTNIMIGYLETDGANISNEQVLLAMSAFETRMNSAPSDQGETDDIIYVLSLSTVVKEINSSSTRVGVAIIEQTCEPLGDLCPQELKDQTQDLINDADGLLGSYNIPPQTRIDQIVGELPGNSLDKLVQDTDNDGVWDRAVIVIGVKDTAETADILAEADEVIALVSVQDDWESLGIQVTLTGPVPISNAITEFSFQLFWQIFPLGCIFVAAGLFLFHSDVLQTSRLTLRGAIQGYKVVTIAGLPTLCSVFWTLGIIGWQDWEVTSTVIIVGPILLALGVSYGLHITNRYAAETGTPEEKMAIAIQSTGKAVLLSAITTIIGFISLVLTPMGPIQAVGLALSGGIAVVLLLTVLLVPNLTMILDLQKPHLPPPRAFEHAVAVPVRWSRVVVVAFLLLVLFSATVNRGNVEENIDLLGMAPAGVPAVEKMQQYSEEFNAGQTGMLLVTGAVRGDLTDDNPRNDDPYRNLEIISDIEHRVNLVDNTTAISIVFLMKSVGVSVNVSGAPVCDAARSTPGLPDEVADVLCLITDREASQDASFWLVLQTADDARLQASLLNIFYDSLTPEMRSLFISSDYEKSLIYVDMPYLPIAQTERMADQINDHAVTRGRTGDVHTSELIGVAAVAIAVNDLIVGSQWSSLLLALGLTLVFLGFVYGDFRFAFLTTLPVAATVGMQWMVMDMRDLDLSLVTVMIGSIMVGVGVDFSIHIANRVRELGSNLDAVRIAGTSTGMSLFESTIVTAAGMLTAFMIPIPEMKPFVVVVIILLFIASASALFLLPAIYAAMIKSGLGLHGGSTGLKKRVGLTRPSRREEEQDDEAILAPLPIDDDEDAW